MFKYEEEINACLTEFNYREEWDRLEELDSGFAEIFIPRCFAARLSPNAKTALYKYYRFTPKGLIKVGGGFHGGRYDNKFNLPVMEMPCAKCSYKGSALYFIGMICKNPEEKEYYLVKVGAAKDASKRVRDYATYNPMIYNDDIILPCEENELKEKEYNCHKYLASMAYAIAQNSNEWFYVTKENYFLLCQMFEDTTFFQMIADGEVE